MVDIQDVLPGVLMFIAYVACAWSAKISLRLNGPRSSIAVDCCSSMKVDAMDQWESTHRDATTRTIEDVHFWLEMNLCNNTSVLFSPESV